jgi:hypothetical protein
VIGEVKMTATALNEVLWKLKPGSVWFWPSQTPWYVVVKYVHHGTVHGQIRDGSVFIPIQEWQYTFCFYATSVPAAIWGTAWRKAKC